MTPPEPDPVFSDPDPGPEGDSVRMARIEGKIDRIIDRMSDLHGDSKDHEARLRAVEATYVTRSMVTAWLAAAIAVVMAVAAIIALVIN